MVRLLGMSINDVNLRAVGSWVLVNGVPEYIREILGLDRPHQDDTGYYDADCMRAVTMSGEVQLSALDLTSPSTGYVALEGGCVYVSRTPERQSRAGLPAHSTIVRRSETDSCRLEMCSAADQGVIARGLYGDRGHMTLKDAMQVQDAVISITDTAAVEMRDSGECVLYGPEFVQLAVIRNVDGKLKVRTRHPLTVAAILGEFYDT